MEQHLTGDTGAPSAKCPSLPSRAGFPFAPLSRKRTRRFSEQPRHPDRVQYPCHQRIPPHRRPEHQWQLIAHVPHLHGKSTPARNALGNCGLGGIDGCIAVRRRVRKWRRAESDDGGVRVPRASHCAARRDAPVPSAFAVACNCNGLVAGVECARPFTGWIGDI